MNIIFMQKTSRLSWYTPFIVSSEKTKIFTRNYKGTFEELVSDIDGYIYFYNNEHFQEHNNGLAPLWTRDKAVV